jgi:hypothetical protein
MSSILLHGIHTPFGDPKVKRLIPYIAPLDDVIYPDYGYVMAVETRRINPALVGMLTPFVKSGDTIFAHSNGCAIAYEVVQALDKSITDIGLVLIDAALIRNITLPDCVKFCHVYYNAGDQITQVAALAELVPFSLVDQNWGDMGHYGYSGTDPRVAMIDCANTKGVMQDEGHSEIFDPPEIDAWGPYIAAAWSKAKWPNLTTPPLPLAQPSAISSPLAQPSTTA